MKKQFYIFCILNSLSFLNSQAQAPHYFGVGKEQLELLEKKDNQLYVQVIKYIKGSKAERDSLEKSLWWVFSAAKSIVTVTAKERPENIRTILMLKSLDGRNLQTIAEEHKHKTFLRLFEEHKHIAQQEATVKIQNQKVLDKEETPTSKKSGVTILRAGASYFKAADCTDKTGAILGDFMKRVQNKKMPV